jgi:dihydroflavonol-4-reductase
VVAPVFITGASGFVGGAVLRHLLEAGHQVRALARSEETAEIVGRAGAIPVRGDVFDPEALLAGMRGCATVFHVAGVNATCVRDPGPMLHTNVEGSVQVLRAAGAAGVRRFVHTSSAATIGEPEGVVGTEATAHRGWFLSQYERSKVMAERRVLELGRELSVAVVCVNPSSVQGPGRTQGSARLLLELLRRGRPPVVDTWLSIVDVDDCAEGHLLAERHGVAGERYLLNGASLTTVDAVALLRSVSGRPPHLLRLPRAAVTVAGTVAGLALRIGGAPTLPRTFCPEVARTLLHGHRFDGSRAERDLGLRYHALRETLERTLAWYRALDLVPDPGASAHRRMGA